VRAGVVSARGFLSNVFHALGAHLRACAATLPTTALSLAIRYADGVVGTAPRSCRELREA
jgi:hypothetical protein